MEIAVSVLTLLAGSGVFMAGMKMMSDGLERSAGKGMKKLFERISDNRFAGVGVGAAATAIIQSSAATTVMAMGFVSAGVMTLTQATAIIMGANIGTTVTGLLVSLSAFDVSLYASVLALVGVIMTFFRRDAVKKAGSVLCGLGLVFVGLSAMSGAFDDSPLTGAFEKMFRAIDFPLLLVAVGALFTALIQSSSAAMGLVIIMAAGGAITVPSSLFIVLGTNIGTCVTAVLAAVGTTNVNVRRTAAIHLTIKLLGNIIFIVPLWIWADEIALGLSALFPGAALQIAMFHVIFNVATTAVLLPFIAQIVRFSERLIKDKHSGEADKYKMKFIDGRLLTNPPIAAAQVKKEILFMASLARENFVAACEAQLAFVAPDRKKFTENEARINRTYHAVAHYMIALAGKPLPEADLKLLGSYHYVINDLERVGDHAVDTLEQADEMAEENLRFSDEATAELYTMYRKALAMFDLGMRIFDTRNVTELNILDGIEREVDDMKRASGAKHIERLNSGDCAVEKGAYFFALLTSFERVADHVINIAHSVLNPTGSQSARLSVGEVR